MFQRIRLFSQRELFSPPRPPRTQLAVGFLGVGCKAELQAVSIHEKDRRDGGVESTEVMKGSQKSEDTLGLKELASNWRGSFFPALGQPRVPQCPLRCVGGEIPSWWCACPRHWETWALGCSCYTVVVVVIYYLSTSPVAERGPGCACPPLSALPRHQGLAPYPHSHGALHSGLRKHPSKARGQFGM